jgi:hypothetical protein
MARIFTLLVFILLSCSVQSQDAIKITDPIPDQKAILVIPSITTQQLQLLKTEFAKYSAIKQAVYFYQNHNCLLVNTETNSTIQFYSDLVKIIEAAAGISEQQIFIKTSAAYDKIMTNVLSSENTNEESSINFIVK